MNTPLLIVIAVLVLFSAFFSSAETAFSSLNKVRLKSSETDENKKKIEKTLVLAENYDMVLSTILIGNNIVNIAASSIATLFFTGVLGDNSDLAATVSTIVMTVVVLIFGEITPKTMAKERAEKFAVFVTPAIRFFVFVFYPLNIAFKGWKKLLSKIFKLDGDTAVTEEELKTYVDEAHTGGELIRSSIEFDDLYVSDILTPRVDVEAVEKYWKLADIEKVFKKTSFSRLPVYIGDIDHIVGVIHYQDFEDIRKRGLKSLRTILKPVPMISPDTKISKLLRILQKSKTHLAVVVDEFGGTEGIVDGTASIDKFFEFFDIRPKKELDIATVNGWVMINTDKIPEVGDSFDYGDMHCEVVSVDGKRADKIKIIVQNNNDEEDSEQNV